jgi:FixJ family two-component response regulator
VSPVPVISVIDDDESVRIALSNLVGSFGYEVFTFASAEAFLQSAQLRISSCVIADVRMSGISGVELQSRLRTENNLLPFIFITAVPEEAIRARALREGAICFLSKPVDEDFLIRCLSAAMPNRANDRS